MSDLEELGGGGGGEQLVQAYAISGSRVINKMLSNT
jgi:hypothetical protein